MLSKCLNLAAKCPPFKRKLVEPLKCSTRSMSDLLPANQYDMAWPKRLTLAYTVVNYWETVPLFTCTAFALAILFYSIYNVCNNKADVVFSSHSRLNNSRTMDLRNPKVLKLFIINQRYPPWPEMQEVLDKMRMAEKRVMTRALTCAATFAVAASTSEEVVDEGGEEEEEEGES